MWFQFQLLGGRIAAPMMVDVFRNVEAGNRIRHLASKKARKGTSLKRHRKRGLSRAGWQE